MEKYRRRNAKRPDFETLIEYYNTHSITETAVHFNVSLPTIYNWIDRLMPDDYEVNANDKNKAD